jgi:hypothetical protein
MPGLRRVNDMGMWRCSLTLCPYVADKLPSPPLHGDNMDKDIKKLFEFVRERTKHRPRCEVVDCDVFRSLSIPHSPYCYWHTIYDPGGKFKKEYGVI